MSCSLLKKNAFKLIFLSPGPSHSGLPWLLATSLAHPLGRGVGGWGWGSLMHAGFVAYGCILLIMLVHACQCCCSLVFEYIAHFKTSE